MTLKRRIFIQTVQFEDDGQGGKLAVYGKGVETWADVEPMDARQALTYGQVAAYNPYRITTRYRSDITVNTECKIKYNGKELFVNSVIDKKNEHKYFEIMAAEKK